MAPTPTLQFLFGIDFLEERCQYTDSLEQDRYTSEGEVHEY